MPIWRDVSVNMVLFCISLTTDEIKHAFVGGVSNLSAIFLLLCKNKENHNWYKQNVREWACTEASALFLTGMVDTLHIGVCFVIINKFKLDILCIYICTYILQLKCLKRYIQQSSYI